MALNIKNNENKKYIYKEKSNPLFPISNKTPNLLNYYSAIKLNIKTDLKRPNKRLASNDLNNLQNKKYIENSTGIKLLKEINKAYSSSRPKDENQLLKLNNSKLSKIKPLELSPNMNDSANIEKYKKNNSTHKRALLSATKAINKTNINLDISKDYKNNLNAISQKNFLNSQIINENNIYNLRKPNNKNNIIEIANLNNNNSYYKNIIINNNSSKNLNSNPNLINPKKPVNNYYLKTEINNRVTQTPKEPNVKLIFNNKNLFGKKLEETPIILKKKDSSLPLKNTYSGINLNTSKDKNAFNGEYKLHLKKPTKNNSNENNIINMNLNNYINIKKNEKIIVENNYKEKNKKINGPEDLHFYFIQAIQEGKNSEIEFKD